MLPARTVPADLLEDLACPLCRGALTMSPASLHCSACSARFWVDDGIPRMLERPDDHPVATVSSGGTWEAKYQLEEEPCRYSDRAAEVLKLDYTAELIRQSLGDTAGKVLDVGCSLGQLSEKLLLQARHVYVTDVSPTAVARARQRLERSSAPARRSYAVANSTALPFRDGLFDAVILSDGLHSWGLTEELKQKALAEVHRTLRPGGQAFLLDYMNPRGFSEFVRTVERGPMKVAAVEYLGDRLWYVLESAMRALLPLSPVRSCFSSLGVARALRAVSRTLGPRGSKHLCVRATKGHPQAELR